MALAPLSQTLILTADGSNVLLDKAVAIPIGAIAPPPSFTVAPSITPGSGTTATMFAANDGTVEDGTVNGRRWLLSGIAIGTGATVKPDSAGSLVLEVSALGTGGVTTVKSAAVTVAAILAPAFSGNPTVSPGSGTTAATYTATDPTVSNGTITMRQWLLGTTVLGTGATIVPGPGNSGSLTRKVTALGTDGSTITITSAAVTVSAIPAPVFSGSPTISPTSGDTSTTFAATDPTISNGTITARAWLLGTTIIGTGSSIVPSVGNNGQLTRRVTGVGTDGSTIVATSDAITVAVAQVILKALTVSVGSGTVGKAISSTISSLTSGSRIELTGAGAAGLSISGAVITGTPTAAGPVYVVETLAGATNSPRTSSALITIAEPAPTPTNTYANSTKVYANNSAFSPDLVGVEQRLSALGGSYDQYRVDYGTGANTASGDTVYAALVKLQNWIATIEAANAPRAFFSDPFFADGMFARDGTSSTPAPTPTPTPTPVFFSDSFLTDGMFARG
ncbi:hypothetical protein QCD71_20295 [Sphingomonas sp. PsM26]|nr:hypothetical protein [Sphingomonas sp. PsM26]